MVLQFSECRPDTSTVEPSTVSEWCWVSTRFLLITCHTGVLCTVLYMSYCLSTSTLQFTVLVLQASDHSLPLHTDTMTTSSAESTWSRTLSSITWRIDLQQHSRHHPQLQEPTAIMQLLLNNRQTQKNPITTDTAPPTPMSSSGPSRLIVEMDRDCVNRIVDQLTEIEAIIHKQTQAQIQA